MPLRLRSGLSPLIATLFACARTATPSAPVPTGSATGTPLPAIDSIIGPIALRVQYPAAGAVIDAADSSFMFGTTATGDASLTINGQPVRVAPNGAWLAWIALPPDSVMRFELVARTARDSQRMELVARRPLRFVPPVGRTWIDSTSIQPRGVIEWPRDEFLPVTVRADSAAAVWLVLSDSLRIPLFRDARADDAPWGIRAFDRDTANLRRPVRRDRFAGVLRGRSIADSAFVEAVSGTDTARVRWPVRLTLMDTLPVVVELDDDTSRTGLTDRITIGRAVRDGTYHWFWPTGTRAAAAGRFNEYMRLRLAPGVDAWVPAADAQVVAGQAGGGAVAGSVTMTPLDDRVRVRIPLSAPVPYEIVEDERSLDITLYGATGDVNWMRYGASDSLVRRAAWTQESHGVRLRLELEQPVWGFRSYWDRGDLIVEVRRPPAIDAGRPLAGRLIVVDPGHPPLGASGPTGFTEAEANLAVSLRLRDLLEEAGARVIMTRIAAVPVDLGARPRLADSVGADILVSIHNNALPDGVNPFPNNGTSVFYNQPRSIPLAMAVQRALVRRLGLRDLGVGRGDLALVRPTWMPSILTEGLFMMVPEQEAALRSVEGQRRYAQGVFEGIRDFLRTRATR
jgi:N-acetylmuramoyl-L-alanine amidase